MVAGGLAEPDDLLQVSPAELEQDLRQELSGVQLIAEIGLSAARMEQVEQAVRSVLRRRGRDALLRDYPAVLATYLAGEGLRSYGTNDKGNGLWNLLSVIELRDDSHEVGLAFRRALRKLGLPDFAEAVKAVGGQTNLMPILLHAGLAASSAHRFWEQIRYAMSLGHEDAADVVALFRRRSTSLERLPQPTRRLVRFGGDLVVDLVDRIIEAEELIAADRVPDPGAVGLPDDLVEALLEGARNSYLAPLMRWPRPRISIDPYGGTGPELELPPLGRELGARGWELDGAVRARQLVSAFDTVVVDLVPPGRAGWRVATTDGTSELRSWSFEAGPVTLFAPDGSLSRNQAKASAGDLLLCRSDHEVRVGGPAGPPATDATQFPPLAGRWAGWRLHRLAPDIPAGSSIWVGLDDPLASGLGARPHVLGIADRRRASWLTTNVSGVVASSGDMVISSLPKLRLDGVGSLRSWRVVSITDGRTIPAADLKRDDDGCLDISELVDAQSMQELHLVARGPLGSDTRLRALLVPGLEVLRPEHPLAPDEPCEILIDGPELRIDSCPGPVSYSPAPGTTRSRLKLSGTSTADREIDLIVPRVSWRLADQTFQCDRIDLALEDVADAILSVRLGVPGTVALTVVDEGTTLFSGDSHDTIGDNGVWTFRLAELADTIRVSGAPRVRLVLKVDDRMEIEVVEVRARYVVSHLEAIGSAVGGNLALLQFAFDEEQGFRGREIVLWPLERPWAPPHRVPLPDDAVGEALLELEDAVPGRYLAHLTLADEWNQPVRPTAGDADTTVIDVGDHKLLQQYVASLKKDDPLGAFEHALLTGARMPEALAPAVAGQAVNLIGRLLETDGADAIPSRMFQTAENALFVDSSVAARAIADAEATDDAGEALRLAVALLPDALDCPIEDEEDSPRTDRLWRRCLPIAAALQPRDRDRWLEHTGWSPEVPPEDPRYPCTADGLPTRGLAPDEVWLTRTSQQLGGIRSQLSLSDDGPLSHTGLTRAMFDLLDRVATDGPTEVDRWRSMHARLNDQRCRRDPVHSSFLDPLEPEHHVARWARFPQDLLAAAFHLADTPAERRAATRALLDAVPLAPSLVTRSLLLAALIHKL